MIMVDKEIKKGQYYLINGNAVRVTHVNSFEVCYIILKLHKRMICDRAAFSSVAKEIKLHG
ncbi:hypothetical protein bas42_0184 [Escherichia phage AndreasVesalius]|nr:hypothetical protein bas42_0184 [Escherichia phage AndreasVesalius]WBY52668.1 hypothetical protein [Escherichia phage REP1]